MAPGVTVTNGSIHMNGNVNGKVYARNGHKTNGTHHKVFQFLNDFHFCADFQNSQTSG